MPKSSVAQAAPAVESFQNKPTVINDFSISVATVNGSGSQTANTALLRALFKMGIPVSGKNLFPSNIHGQPTWYIIRVNKDGYLARKDEQEIVIAMNPASFKGDVASIQSGGVLLYADDIQLPIEREDITIYPMPVKRLAREADVSANLRDYIANMVYVGVLANILSIDMDRIHEAIDYHFKGKQKAVESNFNTIKAGFDWAANNLVKKDPYCVAPMDGNKDCIMADGNTAAALGSIYGGIQFCAWYPITPASSMAESINEYLPLLRKDKDGKYTCAIVQAEDELAAIGMVIGAGWAGLRSVTSTSGPGESLMTEYAGLAFYAEVPIVIWNVQRVGPSTGLPTRTGQGDITETYFLSHGDTRYVILLPGSINECFEFGWRSFDIAERLQTPVFVMSDLDFGMNTWVTPRFEYPDKPMDRGKILWEDGVERLKGDWGRYMDLDGDGIPYRTVPGNRHPRAPYFTRGTGHDERAAYTEDPVIWERVLDRILRKIDTAKEYTPKPVIKEQPGARIGIISFGSNDYAVEESRDQLKARGVLTDYLRLRSMPFHDEVHDFICKYDRVYVVEQNALGQVCQILRMEMPDCAARLYPAAHLDGLPITARWITDKIISLEEK